MVLMPRAWASRITSRPTAELATFWMTQSPGFNGTMSVRSSSAVGGLMRSIAALQHVDRGRDGDDVVALHAPALGPVLALQVDDEIAGPDVRDAGADGGDPAEALRTRSRRQRRPQAIAPPAHRDVGGIDRKREHVEHDLAGLRRPDIGRVGAAHALLRLAVALEDRLLHRARIFQPSQLQTAWPMTRSRSRPVSQGSSSVNMVTHCRHEQGMRVMSVPQNIRSGPNAS